MSIISIPEISLDSREIAQRPQKVREFALAVNKLGDRAKIAMAAAWHEVKEKGYWKSYGYVSFDQYIMEEFSYGRSTSEALLSIYSTYVVKLGISPIELSEIPWYGLREVLSIVNENNVHEILDKLKGMTQKDIKKWLKSLQGLHPAEAKFKTGHKFHFNFESEEQAEVIRQALVAAQTVSGSEVPAENLEVICAEYLLTNLGDSDKLATLEKWFQFVARKFGIKVTWEPLP